MSAINFNNRY